MLYLLGIYIVYIFTFIISSLPYHWGVTAHPAQDCRDQRSHLPSSSQSYRQEDVYKTQVLAIDDALLNDAHKEYNIIGRVNFGVKNSDMQTTTYTEQIEAEYAKNPIVLSVLEHISRKKELYATTLEQLNEILLSLIHI